MENQADQNVIREFAKLLQKNPNLLATVLPNASAVSSDQQTGDMKAAEDDSRTKHDENGGRTLGDHCTYSAEDLLMRRPKNGKGTEAQQTFTVS